MLYFCYMTKQYEQKMTYVYFHKDFSHDKSHYTKIVVHYRKICPYDRVCWVRSIEHFIMIYYKFYIGDTFFLFRDIMIRFDILKFCILWRTKMLYTDLLYIYHIIIHVKCISWEMWKLHALTKYWHYQFLWCFIGWWHNCEKKKMIEIIVDQTV